MLMPAIILNNSPHTSVVFPTPPDAMLILPGLAYVVKCPLPVGSRRVARMANTERLLPRATTALAKTVWERQREPSARKVARALAAAGYPVHFTTVALWKRTGWRAPESHHPLDAARAGLDSIAPVVTGDPHTSIEDLIRTHPDREKFEQLTDCRATPHGGP
jgi:hypothetical protein